MPENGASRERNSESSPEIRVARIGLISAIIVAICGLVGTLVTVLGTAISAYFSSQAAQVPVVEPIRATQTAEARLLLPGVSGEVTAASGNSFLLKNQLVLPVHVYLNGAYLGDLAAGTDLNYVLPGAPASLRWELAKETTKSGRAIGDDMGATIQGVAAGQVIEITNVVGDQAYFYPTISNQTGEDCEAIFNQGWESENVPDAIVPANSEGIGLGYYKLFSNSNVTLICGGVQHWWGLQPDENGDDSFFDLVEAGPGTVEFTLKP